MRGEYLSHPTTRTEGRQYEPRRRLNRRDSQYTECESLHPLEAGTEPKGSGDGSPILNTEDKPNYPSFIPSKRVSESGAGASL